MALRSTSEGIRPSLKIAAAFLVGVAIVVVWLLLPGAGNPVATGHGEVRDAPRGSRGPSNGFRGPSSRRGDWDPESGWSGAAQTLGAGLEPSRDDADPQLVAMNRSHGGGGDAGVVPEFYPTTHRGRLARVSGDVPVAEGAECEVRVLPVRTHRFNCLIKVSCEGIVLYPEPEMIAGYVSCDLAHGQPLRAVDDGVTGEDGDPTVEYDLHARKVVISDARDDGRSFAAELVMDVPRPLRRL